MSYGGQFATCGRVLMNAPEINRITGLVLGAAIEVHRVLGPGLLESMYRKCLCVELASRHLQFTSEQPIPIVYKEVRLEDRFRLDIVVERRIVVEVKAIDALAGVHQAQMLTYLKVTGLPAGLLINFNVGRLMDGVRRLVNPNPTSA